MPEEMDVKTRLILAVAAAALLPACGEREHYCTPMRRSPEGVRMARWPQGSGFDVAYIEGALYDAVERAVAFYTAGGEDPERARRATYGIGYLSIDNCCFRASDGVSWAAGEYLPECNEVDVGIYRRRQKNDFPIGTTRADVQAYSGAPLHTIRANPANPVNGMEQWRWGELELGAEYPALTHEVGHRLYGPKYGHKACVDVGCSLSGVLW